MAADGYELLRLSGTINCLSQPEKVSVIAYLLSILGSVTPPPSGEGGLGYLGAASLRTQTTHTSAGGFASIAYLIYASAPGDGAQGMFYWDSSSVSADDGVNVIRASDNPFPAPGAWVRLS